MPRGDGHGTVLGGSSGDSLKGGAGNDYIDGVEGSDVLRGNSGDDTLLAGGRGDTLHGGAGNDVLRVGDGLNLLDGGTSADTMWGGRDPDSYYVDSKSDQVMETRSAATLWGDQVVATVGTSYAYRAPESIENVVLRRRASRPGRTRRETVSTPLPRAARRPMCSLARPGRISLPAAKGTHAARGRGRGRGLCGTGSDVLHGDDGADWLWGGEVDEIIIGGCGADVFTFAPDLPRETLAGGNGARAFEDAGTATGDLIEIQGSLFNFGAPEDYWGLPAYDVGAGNTLTRSGMCGRPLGREGFRRAALGRVQSCVRPVVAAVSRWS